MSNTPLKPASTTVMETVTRLVNKYKLSHVHCAVSNYNAKRNFETVLISKSGKEYRTYVANLEYFKIELTESLEAAFGKSPLSFTVEVTAPGKLYFKINTLTQPLFVKEVDYFYQH